MSGSVHLEQSLKHYFIRVTLVVVRSVDTFPGKARLALGIPQELLLRVPEKVIVTRHLGCEELVLPLDTASFQ
jgi:hypothetical protein